MERKTIARLPMLLVHVDISSFFQSDASLNCFVLSRNDIKPGIQTAGNLTHMGLHVGMIGTHSRKNTSTMANQISSFLFYSCGFCIIFSLLISPTFSSRVHPIKHVALCVFGDSLFDLGNNTCFNDTSSTAGHTMGQATTWPYGETFFKHPTGRLSVGRIVPDFIAEFFKPSIWKDYLQPGAHKLTNVANFVSGGAGVLNGAHAGTISLWLQLKYFKDVVRSLKKQIGEAKTEKLLNSTVYLISMGGNDYFGHYNSYPNASADSVKHFVGLVTRNLTEILE